MNAVVKCRTQTKKRLPDFVGRSPLVTGDHGRREIFKVALLHQPPPAVGQFRQTSFQGFGLCRRIVRKQWFIDDQNLGNLFGKHTLQTFRATQFLADEKSCDGPYPSAEIRAAFKGLQLLERDDKRLLSHVVRCIRPHSQAAHKHPQPRLLATDLLDEPIMIRKRWTHTELHPQRGERYDIYEKFRLVFDNGEPVARLPLDLVGSLVKHLLDVQRERTRGRSMHGEPSQPVTQSFDPCAHVAKLRLCGEQRN